MKRLALYGGSFDPVHLGHVLVAQAAWEELKLDRVIFIPAAQSPFKPSRELAPPTERLRLLRLALAGRSYCEIDPIEIDRGGVSYTIDTVREYQQRFPEARIFYLIGADHVPLLPKWRESAELARLVSFVCIPRPGEPRAQAAEGFQLIELHGFPLGVSSSQIRERVRMGLPLDLLTGSAVAEAILHKKLYL